MSVTLRTLNNTNDAILLPDGTPLANTSITFTLIDFKKKRSISLFDALSGELIVGDPITVITDATGVFTVQLWPNSRGESMTAYRVDVDNDMVRSFFIYIVDSATPIVLADAKTAYVGSTASSQTLTAFDTVLNNIQALINTVTNVVTTTVNGLMSFTDKVKLDGISAGTLAPSGNSSVAAVGVSTAYARQDHAHPKGDANTVGGFSPSQTPGANQVPVTKADSSVTLPGALSASAATFNSGAGAYPAVLRRAYASGGYAMLQYQMLDNNSLYVPHAGIAAYMANSTPGAYSGDLRFFVAKSGTLTEAARILGSSLRVLIGTQTENTSGAKLQTADGLTFPAIQIASSDPNTLDDYEEGTWSVNITDGTTTATAQSTYGKYQKIGNKVTVWGYGYNINTSGLAAGSQILFSGFPFVSNALNIATGSVQLVNCSFSGNPIVYLGTSSSSIIVFVSGTNSPGISLHVSDLMSGTASIRFTIEYYV